ncbi:sensor histidine kinase [Cohnella ginsengisoli]
MKKKGGFVITGVEKINQFEGKPFSAVIGSRLIMDDNYAPLAIIAIFISPDFIPKLVRSLDLPTVQVTVVDRNGQLVYASDEELASRQLAASSDRDKGIWEMNRSPVSGDAAYSGVYEKSAYSGWTVYLGVNRNEMLKGSRSIRNFTLGIVVALVFGAAGLSWLLARSLSQPVYRMIRSMRAVEKGDFTIPAVMERKDEIGRLESSYGRMIFRIGELLHSVEEKERQKRHAELYALKARIQPHFLYNTLNSIRMLAILQQSTQIAKLIQALNKLLQANMKLDSELVTLEEEIRLLREYAFLMDLRYTNVFELQWRIDQKGIDAAVPPMLLQPILENAIFHGAKGLDRKLNVVVSATLEAGGRTLVIDIADDGAGPADMYRLLADHEEGGDRSARIGLRNVRDRIQLRFGPAYGLTVLRQEGWTIMRMTMPYKKVKKEEEEDDVESSGGGR